jgi:hypothetical protein
MAPASLVQMVQNTIGRNVNNLQDLGDISYDLAHPILRQLTNPEQLRALELNSPQIADKDAEIWKHFINRDIPNWHDKLAEPNSRKSFCYEVYRELKDREEQELEQSQLQLFQAFMQCEMTKEANKANIVDKVVAPKVSRLPKYADGRPNPLAGKSSTYAPSLRNAKSGQQIIQSLRNQTRQAVQQKRRADPKGMIMTRVPDSRIKAEAQRIKEQNRHEEIDSRLIGSGIRSRVPGEETSQEILKKRREVKTAVRRERTKEATTRQVDATTPMDVSPPASTARASVHSTPSARRPTLPQEAHLSPPSKAILTDRESSGVTGPGRAMGVHMATYWPGKKPVGPDPAALERKSSSPIPDLTLNDNEKPNISAYTPTAATRRPPPSIFAPKPKKQRVG